MKTLILAFALLTPMAPAAVVLQDQPAEEITENQWQGALVDWDCKQTAVDQVCAVTGKTQHFALSIDGGILLHFDDRGNEMAAKVVRTSAASGNVRVVATGEREGRLLKVSKIETVKGLS